MKPVSPHMSHLKTSGPIWLTDFSPFSSGVQKQQGKAIEIGILLLITDIKQTILCIFQRPIKSMEDFGEPILNSS